MTNDPITTRDERTLIDKDEAIKALEVEAERLAFGGNPFDPNLSIAIQSNRKCQSILQSLPAAVRRGDCQPTGAQEEKEKAHEQETNNAEEGRRVLDREVSDLPQGDESGRSILDGSVSRPLKGTLESEEGQVRRDRVVATSELDALSRLPAAATRTKTPQEPKYVVLLMRCLPLSEHTGYCFCDGPDTIGEHRAWCPDLILEKFRAACLAAAHETEA